MYIRTREGLGQAIPAKRSDPRYIRWVQQSLNKMLGLRLRVDGIMGPQTRRAVRSFQRRRGLVVDGVVGPRTEAALAKGARGPAATKTTKAPSREVRQEECDKWRFSCHRYLEDWFNANKEVCGANRRCLNDASTILVREKERCDSGWRGCMQGKVQEVQTHPFFVSP